MPKQQSQQVVSPKNASEKEKKLLQIRGDLQGLIFKEDWSGVDGMIRGVKYADAALALSLCLWKNKWQRHPQTLLHDLLTMPEADPPMSLLQLVVDTAPQVLLVEDDSGKLPLHVAIYSQNEEGQPQTRSLEILRFLVSCDSTRKSLSPITFWQAIRRNDENTIKYLLTFESCAKALAIPVNGRVPLYYICKNIEADSQLTPLVVLMIQATADQLHKKVCCFYRAVECCSQFLSDPQALLEIARREKLYCTNHLIDVARRRDSAAAAKRRDSGLSSICSDYDQDDDNDDDEKKETTMPVLKENGGEVVDKEEKAPTASENGDETSTAVEAKPSSNDEQSGKNDEGSNEKASSPPVDEATEKNEEDSIDKKAAVVSPTKDMNGDNTAMNGSEKGECC